jgi:hypothetical protein
LLPPSVRVPCSTVPQEEYNVRGVQGDPVKCLEDGVSVTLSSAAVNPVYANFSFLEFTRKQF